MKKIIQCRLERMDDDNSKCDDTLGEYVSSLSEIGNRFYIVREDGELKNEKGNTVAKCDASYGGGWNECEYFVPAQNVPHNPKNWRHVKGRELAGVKMKFGSVRKADYHYALEDWKRAEALNNGEWNYMGVQAVAEVAMSEDGKHWLTQELTSGGLWGIESDSGEYHFQEVEQEEARDLNSVLKEFGFSSEEIANAPWEELIECGGCNCYHRPGYEGDCRDDKQRFETPDALEKETCASE